MFSIKSIIHVIVILIIMFFLIRFLRDLFFGPKKQYKGKGSNGKTITRKKKVFLPANIKSKADMKYSKILAKFRREHKRNPSKDDLFRIVITASHHTYPVKGRNSRRWMRGKKGHWNRQKVRKYLLEKHNIVKTFKMS